MSNQTKIKLKWSRYIPTMDEKGQPYRPTPKQLAFLMLPHVEAMYGGAAGGGKSDVLLMAALQYVDRPNYAAVIFRRALTDANLSGAIYNRAQLWLAPFIASGEVKHVPKDNKFIFPSGAELSFAYLRTEFDHERYRCFHPDTEFLSKEGWKLIKDAKVGELAATMNPKTRIMEYKPITAVQSYYHNGKMYEKDSRELSLCVTPNHEVWYSKQRSSELSKSQISKLPSVAKIPQWNYWVGEKAKGKTFVSDGHNGRTVSFSAKEWANFLGWYISEGNTWEGRYSIVITQTKNKGRESLRKLFSSIGCNVHIDKTRFCVNNKALMYWLDKHCGKGAYNKKLPKEVKSWSPKYLKIILKSLLDGDGTWITKNRGHFVSTSKQLANDVCEVAMKCGFRPTICERDVVEFNTSKPRKGKCWHVSLKRLSKDTILKNSTVNQNHKTKLREIDYKGTVHCLTVPPHHTVLTRYKGRIAWLGQSAEFQFIGFDELTTFEDFQYTFLFSRLRKNITSDIPLRVRSGTNPSGVGLLWVRKRFRILKDNEGRWVGKHPHRKFIQAFVSDNPHVDASYQFSLHQLDPVTRAQMKEGDWSCSTDALFKDHWFNDRYTTVGSYFSALPSRKIWHRNTCEIFFTVDPAASQRSMPQGINLYKNKEPCWSVVIPWALTADNYLLPLDMIRKQCNIPELLQRLLQAANVYRPTRIICERNGLGAGVSQLAAFLGLPVDEQFTTVDKIKNASTALFRAEKGMIVLPDEAPWLDEMEDELFTWMGAPNETDDIIDNFSNAAIYAQSRVGGTEREYDLGPAESPVTFGSWTNGSREFAGYFD